MSKSFLVDTTLCTACRGCQVACKQWHNLPAEETVNRGSYQNPADLSFDTYKLVRMSEKDIDGKLNWLFFPDQCRHCIEAPCEATAGEPTAIFTEAASSSRAAAKRIKRWCAFCSVVKCGTRVSARSATSVGLSARIAATPR